MFWCSFKKVTHSNKYSQQSTSLQWLWWIWGHPEQVQVFLESKRFLDTTMRFLHHFWPKLYVLYIYIYVYINYPSYILYHPRSRRDLMGRFAYPTSFQQPSLILSIPCWLFSSRKPRVLTITMFFKKQLIWRSRGPPTRTKTHGPIRNRQWNNYHQYLHVQVTRDVFFHQPIWSKNMRKSNRITLPKDRDKTYASCQAPPQCKWILSTEATFPLPRNFRGSISFSPREIFFFTVKGQVEVTSPKKSCEPKSFIFFGGGFKNC